MSTSLTLPGHDAARPRPLVRPWLRSLGGAALALALLGGAYALVAQVAGERGIAPTAASTDIEVRGITVDVQGKSAEDARSNGWREAQRKAWAKVGGPKLSDGQLDGLISAIVIERERLGPGVTSPLLAWCLIVSVPAVTLAAPHRRRVPPPCC